MSKTLDLRKLIQERLLTVCANVFYETAPNDKVYPHIVWNLERVDLGDIYRDDLMIDIDLWDRGTDAKRIEQIADGIEALFNSENLPQDTILPTFWRQTRKNVPDEDKKIKHRYINLYCQNYER